MWVCVHLFILRVGSHHWETISSAHSLLPGFQLAVQRLWESLAGRFKPTLDFFPFSQQCWSKNETALCSKKCFFICYQSKFISTREKMSKKIRCCKNLYNKTGVQHMNMSNTPYPHKHFLECVPVNHNVVKTKCHFKSWSHATFSGITGVLKSSSGAATVLVEHVFGWLLGNLHPHVSRECGSLILCKLLGTVIVQTIDTEKSETSAGWLVDQWGAS